MGQTKASLVSVAACVATLLGTTGVLEAETIRVEVNGKFAFTFLQDGDTNGSLTASRDLITNVKTLDFTYVIPDPANPDVVTFIQGAGTIPNNSFQVSHSSAELHVTTPFPVTSCVIDNVTGEATCSTSAPIRFDLSWVRDGFTTIRETTDRRITSGPVTEHFEGTLKRWSAIVNGSWTGHTASNVNGDLMDTENTTVTREITITP
jgi:hypothetical protein